MPDNWGYVVAAYAVAAVFLGAYWRYLTRRARQLDTRYLRRRPRPAMSDPKRGSHAPAP
jgi:hypothetical protein